MTRKEILVAARKLLSDPKKWTKDTSARNKDGVPTKSLGPDAVEWCASGALVKVAGQSISSTQVPTLRVAAIELGAPNDTYSLCSPIVYINDNKGYCDVLKMFDRAIELEEQGLLRKWEDSNVQS